MKCWVAWDTTSGTKPRGMERGSTRWSFLKGQVWAIIKQINIGTVSRAMFGKLLRDTVEHIRNFSECIDTILNWTVKKKKKNMGEDAKFIHLPVHLMVFHFQISWGGRGCKSRSVTVICLLSLCLMEEIAQDQWSSGITMVWNSYISSFCVSAWKRYLQKD